MEDVTIVANILRSLTPKWDYVVCSIEESKDIDALFSWRTAKFVVGPQTEDEL